MRDSQGYAEAREMESQSREGQRHWGCRDAETKKGRKIETERE